jgi:hypothetical protein
MVCFQFGQILEGIAMEDIGIFYGHLVHFTVFWYIFVVIWNFFPRFGISYQDKSGNPVTNLFHY